MWSWSHGETCILANCYRDSVFLMGLAQELRRRPGVGEASVMMRTEANKSVLRRAGMLHPDADHAGPNDLIVSVKADSEGPAKAAITAALEALQRPTRTPGETAYATLESAVAARPDANLALISIPGEYTALEARRALRHGLHVLLFSSNVAIEDEIDLKKTAHDRGLLLMGPDCGTAIVNGVGLGFANAVHRGAVGIVGAASTGIQEIASLLDQAGLGVSQAIGTGRHDVSDQVGAATTLDAIELLNADPATRVLVMVAKRPGPTTSQRIVERLRYGGKPAVLCLLSEAGSWPAGATVSAGLLEDVVPAVTGALGGERDHRRFGWTRRSDMGDPVANLPKVLPGWFLIPFLFVVVWSAIANNVLNVYSAGLALLALHVAGQPLGVRRPRRGADGRTRLLRDRGVGPLGDHDRVLPAAAALAGALGGHGAGGLRGSSRELRRRGTARLGRGAYWYRAGWNWVPLTFFAVAIALSLPLPTTRTFTPALPPTRSGTPIRAPSSAWSSLSPLLAIHPTARPGATPTVAAPETVASEEVT